MEKVLIKATEISPEIVFDPSRKIYKIEGVSRPESPTQFYAPLFQWLDDYGAIHLDGATVLFDLEYFNTPSARIMNRLLTRLDQLYVSGFKLSVIWMFDSEPSLEEFKHEFTKSLTIPIVFKVK